MEISERLTSRILKKIAQPDHQEGCKMIYRTICQGCKKKVIILKDTNLDMAINKRGSGMFWHPACYRKVWLNKIQWLDRDGDPVKGE